MTFGDLYALFGPSRTASRTGATRTRWPPSWEATTLPGFALTIVAPGEESGTYGSFIDIVGTDDMAEEQG